MEQYRDFTYYSHMHYENALNIGWEENEIVNDAIELDSRFLENLWLYTKQTFNKIRGLPLKELTFNNETIKVGMAEIRVITNKNGKSIRYAASDAVMLDILNRNYHPTEDFISAVIEGAKPGCDEYELFARRYSPQYLWGEDDEYVEYANKILHSIKNKDLRDFMEILDARKDSLETITSDGSLLNASIIANATDISFELLERGFDFNKLNSIELNYAIKMGKNEIVKFLLSKEIIFNLSDPKFNPYFTAILSDNIEAVKLLLDKKVDKNIKYSTPFMWNMDALQYAQKHKRDEIVNLIL